MMMLFKNERGSQEYTVDAQNDANTIFKKYFEGHLCA
jgi:hypothetical protein